MEKLSKLKVLKLASGLSEATYSYCWTLLTIMLPLGGLIHVTWVVSWHCSCPCVLQEHKIIKRLDILSGTHPSQQN